MALIADNDIRTFKTQFAGRRAGLILVPCTWRLTWTENTARFGGGGEPPPE